MAQKNRPFSTPATLAEKTASSISTSSLRQSGCPQRRAHDFASRPLDRFAFVEDKAPRLLHIIYPETAICQAVFDLFPPLFAPSRHPVQGIRREHALVCHKSIQEKTLERSPRPMPPVGAEHYSWRGHRNRATKPGVVPLMDVTQTPNHRNLVSVACVFSSFFA